MYNWAYQYYRGRLHGTHQKLYDSIYRCWSAHRRDVSFPPFLMDADAASQVVQAVILDHPEIFWVNYYRCTVAQSVLGARLHFDFYFHEREINRLAGEASAWKQRVMAKLPRHFSDWDKVWVLFDYLARQVTYGKQSDAYSQTIIGPMSRHNHISVCEGIAKSYKYLCDEANIPCIVVFGEANFGPGQAGPHAWNIVDTGTRCSHIDVTAELDLAHSRGKATQTNFLHSDREMTHYSWDRTQTPLCG